MTSAIGEIVAWGGLHDIFMAEDICILVGRRIRDNRVMRGWRQIDLAAHADISETYVSELELGRSEACLRTLHAIATAFGVSLGDLLAKI